jgi:uncharacterized protein involved in exopolysaccharide biosynthesis
MTERAGDDGPASEPGRPLARDYAFRVYAVDDADELRLKDLWQTLWSGRWRILAGAFGTASLAVAATFLMTPSFRSTVLAAPTTESSASGLASLASQFAGMAALAGVNVSGSTRTAEAVATLRSRAFTEAFIRERGLMPILFADAWDASAGRWRDETAVPTAWHAYQAFDGLRSVEEDLQTGLISIQVEWSDPDLAAQWANGLVADVNRNLRNRAISESRQNLEYLRSELQKNSQVPLQSTIFSLIEAEMRNAMLSNVKQEYAFRVIDPAVVAQKRSWPNRAVFAVLGLFLGGVAGICAAFMRPARATR